VREALYSLKSILAFLMMSDHFLTSLSINAFVSSAPRWSALESIFSSF